MNEIANALVAKMTADTIAGGLSASDGATGGFHRGKAPEKDENGNPPGYPRIHFAPINGLPQYVTVGEAYRKTFVQFTCFAVDPVNGGESGVAIASRLSKRGQSLFTDPDMTIEGHELVYCRPERELRSDTEEDPDHGRDIYSEGFVLELWTAKVEAP